MTYTAPNIPPAKHLFFDRHGGVSKGKYASMNISWKSQDDKSDILKNLEIIADYYHQPTSNLNILIQSISNKAVYIDKAQQFQTSADGAVTDKDNIILGIRTADCAPVLFYDARHHIIGAAHAGWRGALHGIIENTLNLMLDIGAAKKDIAAAIGPCLQKDSFACREDMLQEFLSVNPAYQKFFSPNGETWKFDVENFCIERLQHNGISNISASHINTYTDENYFSYRRNGHRGLISVAYDFPTHLSTIML